MNKIINIRFNLFSIDMKYWLRVCFCISFFSMCFFSTTLFAKDRVIGMKQSTYELLNDVHILIEEKKYDKALNLLNSDKIKKPSAYEYAHVLNLKGSIYRLQENYDDALIVYSQAAEMSELPNSFRIQLLSQTAQLYLFKENYQKSYDFSVRVINESENEYADAYVLAAQASYFLEKYQTGRKYIEKALSLDESAGIKPRESWMLLANAIYYGQNDYKSMQKVLKRLIALYPKAKYIVNLSAIYGESGEQNKQLALMEAVFDGKYLSTSQQYIDLASLFLINDIPFKSATVLEHSLKNKIVKRTVSHLELLSRAWLQAGEYEKSIPPLQEAAQMSDTGELYTRLAEIYLRLARWSDSANALRKALDKGGLKQSGASYLSLGISEFKQKKFESSRKAFNKAKNFKNSKKSAEQWIAYMNQELKKRDQLGM